MKIKMTFEQEFDSDSFYDMYDEYPENLTYEFFVEDICDRIEIWEVIDKAKFKQINED